MKKKILILASIMLGVIALSVGQEKYELIDSSYFAGTSGTVEVTYNNYYNGVKYSDGIVGYQFTTKNYVDTFSKISLEGSDDGVNYVFVDSVLVLTDGNYKLYDSTPEFLKYRLNATILTGDTATLDNIIYTEKRPWNK